MQSMKFESEVNHSNILEKTEETYSKEPIYNSLLLCIVSFLIMIFRYFIFLVSFGVEDRTQYSTMSLVEHVINTLTSDETYTFCLEFIAVILFVLSIANAHRARKRHEMDIAAQITQIVALLTFFPLVRHIKDIVIYFEENWNDLKNYVLQNKQQIILCISVIILTFIVIFYWINRKKYRNKSIFGNTDRFLNHIFLILIVLNIIRFFWHYAGIGNFITDNNDLVKEKFEIVSFFVMLIIIVATISHCKEKLEKAPLIMWVIIGICICGMALAFYDVQKIETLFTDHFPFIVSIVIIVAFMFLLWNLHYGQIKAMIRRRSKFLFIFISIAITVFILFIVMVRNFKDKVNDISFMSALSILFQLIILLTLVFVAALLFMRIIKVIKNFRYKDLKGTYLFKNFLDKLGNRQRGFLYGYVGACLFVLCMILIFLFQLFKARSENQNDHTQLLSEGITLVILAIVFSVVIIFVLCQIGVYLVRTMDQIKDMENKKGKYYGIHGLSAFFALVLSTVSWYVFINVDFSDDTALGVAGDAFRYFAFPVIVILWYSIMFYLLTIVFDGEDEGAKGLRRHIKNKAYPLAKEFVDAIFAPFSLVSNFAVELFEAMKGNEDEQEPDSDHNEGEEKDEQGTKEKRKEF